MPSPFFRRQACTLAVLGLLATAPAALAQTPNYRLELRSTAFTPPANLDDFFDSAAPTDITGGVYYRLVQFYTLPNKERRARIESSWHVKLLDYLPHNTYVVAFPASFNRQLLMGYGVRSVVRLAPENRLHPLLQAGTVPPHALRAGGLAELNVQTIGSADAVAVRAALVGVGATVLHEADEKNPLWVVQVPLTKIKPLAEVPAVLFVEPVAPPPAPEDRPGRSNHRVNYLNSDSPLGRHYDGRGVHVALGDDGLIGPHIDYTGRTDQLAVAGVNDGEHGDHCAGIIMGAGNLDPRQRGMAPGVELKVYEPYENLNNAFQDFTDFNIRVTSTSYSDGCHTGYTTFAQTVDRQTRQLPTLLHVFSAGNNGTQNCGFITGWGNITGGNKSGKNVIATGAVNSLDQLASFSSRGPTVDGRIKPEVCAVGVDVNSTLPGGNGQGNQYGLNSGTSMACPGAAGTSALLYQVWRERHSGQDPTAAVVKAALMATADDLGQPGPDFQFGYGRINARRAALALEENRLYVDSVDQGELRTLTVNVPAGTRQLRLLTYWTDFEGAVLAGRALVNDLDTELRGPDSVRYQPWVLDPRPNALTLDAPAIRARDSLNNTEQITLDAPAPGQYTLRIAGAAVPRGAQSFVVITELLTDSITVTYPLGGEAFAPADAEILRWDAFGTSGSFDLTLSADGGATWTPLATVPGTARSYNWQPPVSRNGQRLLLKVSRGGHTGRSESPFSIQTPPTNLRISRVCPDSATFEWTAVPGAARYEIYRLGTRYMDSIGVATAPRFVVSPTNPLGTDWLSVRAVMPNGATSRRAIAVQRAPGTLNCTLALDAEVVQLLSPSSGTVTSCSASSSTLVTLQVRNAGTQPVAGARVFYRVDAGPIQSDTLAGPLAAASVVNHTFSVPAQLASPGTYRITAWVRMGNDGNRYNDSVAATVTLVSGTTAPLPLTQNVDSWTRCSTASDCGTTICGLGGGWVNTPNGTGDDFDWRVNAGITPSTNTGPDLDHTLGTAQGRYLYLEATGCTAQTAVLTSPCLNLATQPLAQDFTFWYHAFGVNMGELHVDILPDSGAAVVDAIPAIRGNQGNQWRQARVSLAPFKRRTVTVRLRGITGADFASDLALDDFNVGDAIVQGVRAEAEALRQRLALAPNPTTGAVTLSRTDLADGPLALTVLDVRGRTVAQGTLTGLSTTLDLGGVASGTYSVRIVSARTAVAQRLIVQP
jgi:subtilisin family serine protease